MSGVGGLSALGGMPRAPKVAVILELFIVGVLVFCKTAGGLFITFTEYASTHTSIL